MKFTADKFVGELGNLGIRVAEALKHLEEPPIDISEVHLLGPFPVFVINATDFVKGKTQSAMKRSGWRGVILAKDEPIALVDFSPSVNEGEFSISVRGREAAMALMLVLRAAEEKIDSRGTFNVRFVTVPSLFITGLWLAGKSFVFIPTRIGSRTRPSPKLYDRLSFIHLIKNQLSAALRHGLNYSTNYNDGNNISAANNPPLK
jgi:hypothetical protein